MKLILLISSLWISVTCDSVVGDDVIHQIDQAIMKVLSDVQELTRHAKTGGSIFSIGVSLVEFFTELVAVVTELVTEITGNLFHTVSTRVNRRKELEKIKLETDLHRRRECEKIVETVEDTEEYRDCNRYLASSTDAHQQSLFSLFSVNYYYDDLKLKP